MNLFDMHGKIAIVTGGHMGLGKGIVEALAEAGANIVICARRLARCQEVCSIISEKYGVKCLPIKCDVSRSDDVRSMVKSTLERFDKIDVLVNNAGMTSRFKSFFEMNDEDWDSIIDINLKGTFLCSREVAKEMIMRKEGKIINISSVFGFVTTRKMSGYCTSKAGINHLTKAMALDLVDYNIQVNAISPGFIKTELTDEWLSSQNGLKFINKSIPVRRLGEVKELKGAVLYLASSASSYTTGSVITVDGGKLAGYI